ncbi:MAG: hypothetical protein AAF213_03215 [Pseudomonadota bacterium]
MTDDDTDSLVGSLLNMGYLKKHQKKADQGTSPDASDNDADPVAEPSVKAPDHLEPKSDLPAPRATAMPLAKKSADPKKPAENNSPEKSQRRASQAPPPGEKVAHRRARKLRELAAEQEKADETQTEPLASLGADDGKSGDIIARMAREPVSPPKPDPAAKAEEKKKPSAKATDGLRGLADTKTPSEEYRRRRKLLKYDVDIGGDGLDTKFARYDRRKQAMFFAEMLATRQFDSFSSDKVWRAARMESRITFLNALLAIHSKIYGLSPAKLDDRFYEDISSMPSAAFNPTGNTSFDRERGMILLYSPFWKNEVNFQTMVRECVEQNIRHHVRQWAQLYSNGQLRPDDPRFAQAALFHIQLETYDEISDALSAEARQAGEHVETKQFVIDGEMGFDVHAKLVSRSIHAQLLDVIDEAGGTGRR